jgi:hypothetical protein
MVARTSCGVMAGPGVQRRLTSAFGIVMRFGTSITEGGAIMGPQHPQGALVCLDCVVRLDFCKIPNCVTCVPLPCFCCGEAHQSGFFGRAAVIMNIIIFPW